MSKWRGMIKKWLYFFTAFCVLILLSGCDKERVIKMNGAKIITCEGLEKATGSGVVVTIGEKKTIIQYMGYDGEGVIVAEKCRIE